MPQRQRSATNTSQSRPGQAATKIPLIRRLELQNYKSIASCNPTLSQLTFVIGPSGAGKSNFLDGLQFVSDSLAFSLKQALRIRGGLGEVRKRSGGRPNHVSIRVDFTLPGGIDGHYSFKVGALPESDFFVQRESCQVGDAYYSIDEGKIVLSPGLDLSPAPGSCLYLGTTARQLDEFRPVYDCLSQMAFYDIDPGAIRRPQLPTADRLLRKNAENIASVVANIHSTPLNEVTRLLQGIAPNITEVRTHASAELGGREILEFLQQATTKAPYPWRFHANTVAEGTLRAFAILIALFQQGDGPQSPHTLIGIDKPETSLHPAALGLLLDIFFAASSHRQIILTGSSPVFLDDPRTLTTAILAADFREDRTQVANIGKSGRKALRRRLVETGEPLELTEFPPDPQRAH